MCASVLSTDGKTDTDALAINAASAAIMTSDINWRGPVAAVRIADLDGRLVLNPTEAQLRNARLDVLYAGTRDSVVLLEVQVLLLAASGAQKRSKSILLTARLDTGARGG